MYEIVCNIAGLKNIFYSLENIICLEINMYNTSKYPIVDILRYMKIRMLCKIYVGAPEDLQVKIIFHIQYSKYQKVCDKRFIN